MIQRMRLELRLSILEMLGDHSLLHRRLFSQTNSSLSYIIDLMPRIILFRLIGGKLCLVEMLEQYLDQTQDFLSNTWRISEKTTVQ